jgi:hypothetical protein
MMRYMLSGICAVVLIGLLGACGGQQDPQARVAVASAALSAPGHGNGATVLFDAFPYNVNMNVSYDVEPDGSHLAVLETSDPDYARSFWCPTFPPPSPGWPYEVPGFPDGWLLMDTHDTITPSVPGKYNAWSKGLQYFTVFKYVGPVTDPPTSDHFWCDVIHSPIVARGVSEYVLRLHWDNTEQSIITQAGKGTLTAPGCPTGKARFEVYGPVSFSSVFASLDFSCTKK